MPFQASAEDVLRVLGAREASFARAAGIQTAHVTTDSRDVVAQSIFIARKGEASDGHLFIPDALKRGATVCVVEKDWIESEAAQRIAREAKERAAAPFSFLGVSDPTRALGDLAREWRRRLNLRTITVSGSNGKTTTKEMLRVLLTTVVGPGSANKKSFNNHVGLPQTILDSSAEDRWLLLEAGMNHPGELDYLGSIAEPDVAILLNIGPEHIGFFNDLAGIADAECEILPHIRSKGVAVLNGSDDVLGEGVKRVTPRLRKDCAKWLFGERSEFEASFKNLKQKGFEGSDFQLLLKGEESSVSLPLVGRHNVVNAVGAALSVKAAFPDVPLEKIAKALSRVEGAPMRLEIHQLPRFSVINDAYNANPASMYAALETARSIAGKADLFAVFGDMLELGALSAQFHHELGVNAARAGVRRLFVRGTFAEETIAGAQGAGLTQAVIAKDDAEILRAFSTDLPSEGGVVLIKGSRGAALEGIAHEMVARFKNVR